jgi:hypothetical protein
VCGCSSLTNFGSMQTCRQTVRMCLLLFVSPPASAHINCIRTFWGPDNLSLLYDWMDFLGSRRSDGWLEVSSCTLVMATCGSLVQRCSTHRLYAHAPWYLWPSHPFQACSPQRSDLPVTSPQVRAIVAQCGVSYCLGMSHYCVALLLAQAIFCSAPVGWTHLAQTWSRVSLPNFGSWFVEP